MTDDHEITYHRLNVVYNHLFRVKGILPEDNGFNNNNMVDPNLQNRILETIESMTHDESGVSFDLIANSLNGIADPNSIKNTIDILLNEGHIYPTDQDCYALTNKN